MRKLFFIALVGLSSACSSPRYAGNFRPVENQMVYNAGRIEAKPAIETTAATPTANLVASTKPEAGLLTERGSSLTEPTGQPVRKTYAQMNKTERKNIRQQVKAEIKNYVKSHRDNVKAAKQAQRMDHDLMLAAVFGAVGVVALIISGEVFYIVGGIALIIGVIFFVKWLVRQ